MAKTSRTFARLLNSIAIVVVACSLVPVGRSTSALGAQIQIGTVRVHVTDPAGAVVAGAHVVLSNRLSKYTRAAESDQTGATVFDNVPFDTYQLSIDAPPFERNSRTINVSSNLVSEVVVRLAIRGASETVEVQADSDFLGRISSSSE